MNGDVADATRPQREATRLDGVYVHESGVPGSPAVVFLQGSAASGGMWRYHMARLSGYHCLAPDLPGFGRSNHLICRSRTETAELVAELIEGRIPGRRASVVGLSWGGSVAHALLARHADLLDRVIIDGCGGLPWWGTKPFLAGLFAISPFLHSRPVVSVISRMVGMDEQGEADIRAATAQAFRRSFAEGFTVKITPEEVAAPCPTLFVAGEGETVIRRSNAALAALMPHAIARFVPNTSHGWIGFDMDLHLAMVEGWLAGQALPGGLAVENIAWPKAEVERLLAQPA